MKKTQQKRHDEIIEICKAFNLGNFITDHVMNEVTTLDNMKFQLSEFKTSQGVFKHYFRIK